MYKLNRKLFNEWRDRTPYNKQLALMMKHTGFGVSTIQKILIDRYPNELKPPTRKAMAEMLGEKEAKLWRKK